jgi:sporulation protein YlmC with PRC-barrel domain
MRVPTQPKNQDIQKVESMQQLMVSGFVCPENSCDLSGEIRRGMLILSSDGLEVGKVAAIVLNGGNHKATHVLLSRLPKENGYWLVPVDMIEGISEQGVQLSVSETAVESLTEWHSI